MDVPSTLLSIAVIWGIAALTPGPNFFVVLRMAAVAPRAQVFATVAGIVTATLIWGLAGFFGISALFAAAPWLYIVLKLAGGCYLAWLGLRLIRASFRARSAEAAAGPRPAPGLAAAWRLGLMTNLANPKTSLFVSSLFATTLPVEPDLLTGLAAAGTMMLVSTLCYGAVGLFFGAARLQRAYAGAARLVDRLAGGIFIALGARLALDR